MMKNKLIIWVIICLVINVISHYGDFLKSRNSYLFALGIKAPAFTASPAPTPTEFSAILEKATAGEAEAQLYMGVFHANGDVVEQDYAKAAEWYRRAAEQGEARAQRYLGLLLSLGVGVERDRRAAFDWFRRADKAGDPAASLEISAYPLFYRESIMSFLMGDFDAWRAKAFFLIDLDENIPSFEDCFWRKYYEQSRYLQNDAILAKFVVRRAEEGDPEAATDMVKLHILGQGVPVDPWAIERWLHRAVQSGEPYAQFMYGYAWRSRYFSAPLFYGTRQKLLAQAAASGKEKYFQLISAMVNHSWELYGYEKGSTLFLRNSASGGIFRKSEEEEDAERNKFFFTLSRLAKEECLAAEWILAEIYTDGTPGEIPPRFTKKSPKQDHMGARARLAGIYMTRGRGEADYVKTLECVEKLTTFPDKRIWSDLKLMIFGYLREGEKRNWFAISNGFSKKGRRAMSMRNRCQRFFSVQGHFVQSYLMTGRWRRNGCFLPP